MAGWDVPGPVVVDEGDQLGVQRQVAVLTELAHRDVRPRSGAGEHHGIGSQAGELADPQPGAQQYFHGDADQHPAVVAGGAQQLRGSGVVEGLGQGVVLAGQVAGEHRHPGRGLIPAPFIEADEEHPQGAQPVSDGDQASSRYSGDSASGVTCRLASSHGKCDKAVITGILACCFACRCRCA
jgi:hypothetical protein